ncbi:hypothetical protein EYC98_07045 [Halieaceae bacterium IMCC14734]|uniref:Uncharacterized protein n=1 Tax=Candidatus Litorirhabdus singularis TaxID=2518993 RepID=A0ABT3TEC0_9GAMM|nr:hypothetical protein [Candidatus Litorirhabdus singularis]MCX2980631.1 hypothetical protein [Candidatus Litorirhabdus singularis]
MSDSDSQDFLSRPQTIRRLWWGFSIVLALTVAAQLVIYVKGYFVVDGWFGFGAVYGFLSCLLMVLAAKALGYFLKKPADFYQQDEDDA